MNSKGEYQVSRDLGVPALRLAEAEAGSPVAGPETWLAWQQPPGLEGELTTRGHGGEREGASWLGVKSPPSPCLFAFWMPTQGAPRLRL